MASKRRSSLLSEVSVVSHKPKFREAVRLAVLAPCPKTVDTPPGATSSDMFATHHHPHLVLAYF